jgi:hypothetical protein
MHGKSGESTPSAADRCTGVHRGTERAEELGFGVGAVGAGIRLHVFDAVH